MSLVETVALGLALGADSLSVCIGMGMAGMRLYRVLKLALLFSVTQGVLLVGGAKLAVAFHLLLEGALMNRCDLVHAFHIALSLIGAVILCLVGINLIRAYVVQDLSGPICYKGRVALLFLTLSVSMDAFSSGVGLGMSEMKVLLSVGTGVTAVIFVMAFFGLRAGHHIGRIIGRTAEPVGGVLLILLAIRLVLGTLL
ncbi:MAG: hypothetical protein GX162_06710 [Firmicutes bacterium]|nr:hypothetical protein [Bacillota bacterium]